MTELTEVGGDSVAILTELGYTEAELGELRVTGTIA
jgi:hypothetical protein